MTNYEKLVSYLPDIYKKENNLKFLEIVAKSYDNFDSDIATLDKIWLLTEAQGEYLDILGANVGIYRTINQTDSVFRRRVKLVMYNIYFIPILDNLINMIEGIMGYYAESITEGWQLQTNKESGLLDVLIVVPAEETSALLIDLEKVYSAGVRISWKETKENFICYEPYGDLNTCGVQGIFKKFDRFLIPVGVLAKTVFEKYEEQNKYGVQGIYKDVEGGL